jgi:mono/diheme cytochrome c family protein
LQLHPGSRCHPPPGYQQQPVAASQAESTEALFPLIPPDTNEGKAIYQQKCAPCHGISGLGDGERAQDLPNLVTPIGSLDVARQASPAEWFNVVTEGNLERFMPPFTSLTDRQRWDVVAYAFSLSIVQAAGISGAELYTSSCSECHGWDGKGDQTNAASQNPTSRT